MNSRKHANLIIILSLILFNFIIYFNAIGNEFVWDDVMVRENHKLRDAGSLKEILTMEDAVPNFPGTGFFRPLTSMTYFVDYKIHGGKAYGYRLTNLIFHILCSIMLFYLVMLISGSRLLASTAALIFSSLAVHVEAVTFIAGRNNVVCTLFILLSLYYYIKSGRHAKKAHIVYSMIFLFLGAASKEFAFVIPVIFILYDLSFDDDYSTRKHLGKYIAAFAMVFLFIFYKSFAVSVGDSLNFDTPTLYIRIITTFPIMVKYIVSQVVPYNLSIYINMPLKGSFLDLTVIGSFLLLAALIFAIFRYKKSYKLLFFSFLTYLILLLPVSNIIKIPGALMADRWLYPASAFFSLFLAHLIFLVSRKQKNLALTGIIVLVMSQSVFTVQRNHVFKNNILLFSDTIKSFPKSSIARANLGLEYQQQGNLDEALQQYQLALKYNPDPNDYVTYNNLGALYELKNEPEKALEAYKKVYMLNPDYAPAAYNLGNLSRDFGNINDSNKYFKIAISSRPDFYSAYFNLGLNYINQQRYKEAIETLQKALALAPEKQKRDKILELINYYSRLVGQDTVK